MMQALQPRLRDLRAFISSSSRVKSKICTQTHNSDNSYNNFTVSKIHPHSD